MQFQYIEQKRAPSEESTHSAFRNLRICSLVHLAGSVDLCIMTAVATMMIHPEKRHILNFDLVRRLHAENNDALHDSWQVRKMPAQPETRQV